MVYSSGPASAFASPSTLCDRDLYVLYGKLIIGNYIWSKWFLILVTVPITKNKIEEIIKLYLFGELFSYTSFYFPIKIER